jgi:uncharacterized protein YdaU (DUF1376 family)
MAEFPALPIFTDAYLGDTRHLTTAQHGAYFLLLLIAWRTSDCSLPDDDVFLARCVGMDRRSWINNKPVIMAFWFRSESGRWQQKRLLDERNFAEQVRRKNSIAGKASALKRQNRGSTSVQPDANQISTPSPSPMSVEKGKPFSYTPAFEQFWSLYPKTQASKKESFSSYQRAIHKGATHEDIERGAREYAQFLAASGSPAAHATTWLNNERWSVDYAAVLAQRARAGQPRDGFTPTKDDRARAAVMRAAERLDFAP